MELRQGEDDCAGGGGAEDVEADFEGIIEEGEELDAQEGEERVDDQLQSTDGIGERLSKDGFEVHGSQTFAEDDHAQRRGHSAQQGDGIRHGRGEADPEQIERNRHRNGQRGRIEDCRSE